MDLFPNHISCAASRPKHKTKTTSEPIPKLARPLSKLVSIPANPYQNQYQCRQIHIKTKIQDQNSKTNIGVGTYLSVAEISDINSVL